MADKQSKVQIHPEHCFCCKIGYRVGHVTVVLCSSVNAGLQLIYHTLFW